MHVVVDNQPGFEWWSFLLGGFAGSALAGTIVLGLQWFFDDKNKKAHQTLLLNKLKEELSRVSNKPPVYEGSDKIHIRDPVSIASIVPLQIEDMTVFPKTERAQLANALIDCFIALEKYKNRVNVYINAQINKSLSEEGHKQAFDDVVSCHKALIAVKKELLSLINSHDNAER